MKPVDLLDAYSTAVAHKDVEAYASIFDRKVRVFDMWQQWSYEGIEAWKEVAKGWFTSLGSDKDIVRFHDVEITEDGDMALITAIARFTAVSEKGEELRYLENRLTWVAQKENKIWKIIHQHTSSPVDFTAMRPVLQRPQQG